MSDSLTRESHDERLEALGRLERRRLLLRLSKGGLHDEPRVDFGDLQSNGSELDPLVAMRCLHLPTLEEHGFVCWHRETDAVTRGPRFDELEPLLQALREIRDELPGRWV